MLVPIRGVPTWRVETNIVTEFCYESVNSYLEELINIFKVALFYYKDSSDGKILKSRNHAPQTSSYSLQSFEHFDVISMVHKSIDRSQCA